MKKIYSLLLTLFILSTIHAQIDQKINKSSGTLLTSIIQIDSIRFNNNQTMQVVLKNGNIINHTISDINNVIFLMPPYPAGTVSCTGYPTAVVDVVSAQTGKTWMDRNLGATQVATSSTDVSSFGDLYQWSRRSDGHQCRNSGTTSQLPGCPCVNCTNYPTAGFLPSHGAFITQNRWYTPCGGGGTPWVGGNGFNNPCPSGYRVPTYAELYSENINGNQAGAFASPLKFPAAGKRNPNGSIINGSGTYWTSQFNPPSNSTSQETSATAIDLNNVYSTPIPEGTGASVRCIKVDIPGQISSLNCNSSVLTGTLISGVAASGVSISIPYTGGNEGFYNAQVVNSTGVTGLTANLMSGIFANGSGNLIYTITGTPSTTGIANFAINIGGRSCTFSCNVTYLGTVNTLNCSSAINSGTLTAGIFANGVSSSIPYTGGNSGSYPLQTVASAGVTGLTATLNSGTLTNGSGNLNYIITGTPSTGGSANFTVTLENKTCTFIRNVNTYSGTINTLNCSSTINVGTLTVGVPGNGVNSVVSYSGGNSGSYPAQTVASTGVLGLTANIAQGLFANGNGTLIYTITGTPSTSGTANFALNIGGQTCVLTRNVNATIATYPSGTVFCGSVPTTIVEVNNPITGKIWMDRNLGATQVATSSTDENSYGDLYQWGRGSDGHQCRTSATTSVLSSNDQPGNGNFILSQYNSTIADWRSPQNNNLWQGVNGVNNPCPSGYYIPTSAELNSERLSWSSNDPSGAFASPLKLPMAGARVYYDGSIVGTSVFSQGGYYWSSTINSTKSSWLKFNSQVNSNPILYANAYISNDFRSYGCSVRCIKVIPGQINSLNCNASILNGTLISGIASVGVSISIPYSGGNGGYYNSQVVNSEGVMGLTANLQSGTLADGSGSLVYNITGTPTSSGTAIFNLNLGGQICELHITVSPPAVTVTSLDCQNVTINGSLFALTNYNGISLTIPYQGSNGGTYNGQIINSTGVIGLTATLPAGVTYLGGGALIFNLSGTPASSGIAHFWLDYGGQSCEISINVNPVQPSYASGSIFCNSINSPTVIVNVISPITGKTWMDRNLGATQVAANSNDVNAYGDLYQWGRRSDGHQCRNSTTITTLSSVDQPTHGKFIMTNAFASSPRDWRSPQNTNLWQGLNGINNPCPSGYRLPTNAELYLEFWNSDGSFYATDSPLKFTTAGVRSYSNGNISTGYNINTETGIIYISTGFYWSSTISGTNSISLNLSIGDSPDNSGASNSNIERANGASVRCIKN